MLNRLVPMMVVVMAGAALAQSEAAQAERCAVRVSIAFTGKSPTAAQLALTDPQSEVDAMLSGADFNERFARFINASFNDEPGLTAVEDSAYYMTKYVLENDLPWTDMFLGQYKVDVANNVVSVTADANGLGYFRSPAWLRRYAGNEEDGIKLQTAYRLMHNTVGLRLFAAGALTPTADQTKTGREASACRGCHFDGWYALDRVSSVLTTVSGTGNNMRFTAPTAGPQELLGGITVADDKELVTALVNSEAADFNVCRLAFQFLYGRKELSCEGPVFDRCMEAYKAERKIQNALRAVAKDPTYCR